MLILLSSLHYTAETTTPEAIHISWKSKDVVSNCVGTSTAKEWFITGIVYLNMWLWLIQ